MVDALNICCSLLSGALWPLQKRFAELIEQRNILTQLYTKAEESKCQIKSICDTLQQDVISSSITQSGQERNSFDIVFNQKRRNPIQLFRIGAIAVLAANRLIHLVRCNHLKFFTLPRMFNAGISSVYYGGYFDIPKATFQGLASKLPTSNRTMINTVAATTWLTSPSLQMRLIKAVSELQHYLASKKQELIFTEVIVSLNLLFIHATIVYSFFMCR